MNQPKDDVHQDEAEELDEDPILGGREDSRSLLEGLAKKLVEKGIEASVGTFSRADSAIRGVVEDTKVPREVLSYVFSQVDESKNALVGAVAGEVRDFLEQTDIAAELRRALTSLSFEVKTEIRFIPNEAGEMKPRVKAKVASKREPRRRRRDRKKAPEGEAKDGAEASPAPAPESARPAARASKPAMKPEAPNVSPSPDAPDSDDEG